MAGFLYFVLMAVATSVTANPIAAGEHCVAYQVEEVKFFVSSKKVVGKNCDIAAQVLPEVGGNYHIEINIPIRSFSSGDSDRDKAVLNILKADKRPEITFVTDGQSPEEWRELFSKGKFDLAGKLRVGDHIEDIRVPVNYSANDQVAEVEGVVGLRFKDLDIKPPKVGGGVVAKVNPRLELAFRFKSDRILGADAIRLDPSKESDRANQ